MNGFFLQYIQYNVFLSPQDPPVSVDFFYINMKTGKYTTFKYIVSQLHGSWSFGFEI